MELSNIVITHLSLVKSGANGKQIIYKSAKEQGAYENTFTIAKTDSEEGTVTGIVYAPDQIDSQGDTATAEEIKKAAYGFMKSKNIDNVDREHDFSRVDAFVAQSWIVQKGDPLFPDDEGAWAVTIQLESDELKELAKSGQIAGLSMAGEALKKADTTADPKIVNFLMAMSEAMSGMYIDIHTRVEKGETVDMDAYKEAVRKKVSAAVNGVAQEINTIGKTADQAKSQIEKQAEVIKNQDANIRKLQEKIDKKDAALEALEKRTETTTENVETLQKESKEVQEALKKSNQSPKPTQKKEDENGGIL